MRLAMVLSGVGLAIGLAGVVAEAKVDCDAAICAAQATLDQECPCSGQGHGGYMKCTAMAVKSLVAAGTLPKVCGRKILRCASTSTCGRPGFVACNFPTKGCRVLPSEARCATAGGTVDPGTSCCAGCP